MPAIEQYPVVEEINLACSRSRDPLSGNSVLLHKLEESSPAVGLLQRTGFLLAQGSRSGVFHVVTPDRADLLDLPKWTEENKTRDPGEFTRLFHAPTKQPGEFTQLFQAGTPENTVVNKTTEDLSVTKTMVRPILAPQSAQIQIPPQSNPIVPVAAKQEESTTAKQEPNTPLVRPSGPSEFTRLFGKPSPTSVSPPVFMPEKQASPLGDASGIFQLWEEAKSAPPDERTKVFPASFNKDEKSATTLPLSRQPEKPLVDPRTGGPVGATNVFLRPSGVSESAGNSKQSPATPIRSSGPGDYTRVFRRGVVEAPSVPLKAAEEPKVVEPATTFPGVPKPDNTKPLLIAILILSVLLLLAIGTIGILLLRR